MKSDLDEADSQLSQEKAATGAEIQAFKAKIQELQASVAQSEQHLTTLEREHQTKTKRLKASPDFRTESKIKLLSRELTTISELMKSLKAASEET